MTLIKKDGTVYVLEGPNPLVKTQQEFDSNNMIFHNFSWDDITMKISRATATVKKPKAEPPKEEHRPEPIIPPKEPEIEEKVISDSKSEEDERTFDLPYIKYKVLSYCLPAKIERKTDDLYGDSWTRVKYGNKIVFPSIMLESNDFSIEFWTSDPNSQITEKSIIYPFAYEVHNSSTDSYDKVPYDEYRWWKVDHKEQKEGGWLFRAIPSETQPDFSS
jgi:hypothetical protein